MRERDIEKYLIHQVEKLGGEVRKVQWVGRNGAPDRLVMLPGYALWVELKRPGGKAAFPKNPHERQQQREHERMRAAGQRVEVIDSFESVDGLLKE